LDGNRLTFVVKAMGVEIKQVIIITKLTDTELVSKEEGKDKVGTFKKIKDK
jgi:hypothetical protein